MEVTWSFKVNAQIPFASGPTIIDNILFVLDMDGNLHAFEEDK
ncbi:MAG: PQQ-binding-like beta-propeller repeat protein [bacterium]|nr:PQQ-binding-like beta-propeller repeat protein [bacterium]